MNRKMAQWVAAGVCLFLAACAVITVNVYFPEKAAKEAYKSLDEMLLLKPGEEKKPSDKAPAIPSGGSVIKPQSKSLPAAPVGWSLVNSAYAAENEADTLAVELASMPEVIAAYDEMRGRLTKVHALFDSGAVGLTSQGLVTVREKSKVTPEDEALITAENGSRKVVVTSMAKAILKLNHQKETGAALGQVMPKAAATFADTRREKAKPGWWMQLENGRWVQK